MTLPEKLILPGLVVDRQGNSLPGVTIVLKATSMGSVTDALENFKFEISEMEEMILVFSFVGMKTLIGEPYRGIRENIENKFPN